MDNWIASQLFASKHSLPLKSAGKSKAFSKGNCYANKKLTSPRKKDPSVDKVGLISISSLVHATVQWGYFISERSQFLFFSFFFSCSY